MSVEFLEQLSTFQMVSFSDIELELKEEKSSPRESTTTVFDVSVPENNYVEFNEYYFWISKPNKLSGIL